MSSQKQRAAIPYLRFPEFRDAGLWEVKQLGDVGPVLMCKRVLKSQTSATGDVPFYKIGTFGKQADAHISKELYDEFRSAYPFPKKGDILISAAGTIGRTVVYDGQPAYFQDSNIVWIGNDENLVSNEFLYFSYQIIDWLTDDNTISRLYNENLRSIKIAFPSRSEQQKIADCLSSLDDLIRAEVTRLDALKAHKKGLMQQLFPAPTHNSSFTTHHSLVPRLRFPEFRDAGPWKVKRLGEVCRITNGTSNAQDHEHDGAYPLFDRSEIIKKSNKFLFDCEAVIIPGEGMKFIPKYYIGKFDLHQRAYALMDFHGNGRFIYYQMDASKNELANKAVMSTVLSLRIPILEGFHVTFPSIEEQQKIADCLSSLDDLIRAREQRIEALKTHKKGLMQQLFPQEVV